MSICRLLCNVACRTPLPAGRAPRGLSWPLLEFWLVLWRLLQVPSFFRGQINQTFPLRLLGFVSWLKGFVSSIFGYHLFYSICRIFLSGLHLDPFGIDWLINFVGADYFSNSSSSFSFSSSLMQDIFNGYLQEWKRKSFVVCLQRSLQCSENTCWQFVNLSGRGWRGRQSPGAQPPWGRGGLEGPAPGTGIIRILARTHGFFTFLFVLI